MPFVLLAQMSPSPEENPVSVGFALALVGVLAVALCLPFLLRRGARAWSFLVLAVALAGQFALLNNDTVRAVYISLGAIIMPALLALIPPGLLLLWRRTRRLGFVLCGLSVVSALTLFNYFGEIAASIGYLLLLIALWPCWRLLFGAPRGRELPPVVASRGVLHVRSWPVDGRWAAGPPEGGFSLVSALVGLACLTVAFGLAALVIAGTTSAIRRADHLAVATDLLESARERALLGAATGDLTGEAAAALPHGSASVQRTPNGPRLVRITATATWRERDGKPGRTTLEWLALERSP